MRGSYGWICLAVLLAGCGDDGAARLDATTSDTEPSTPDAFVEAPPPVDWPVAARPCGRTVQRRSAGVSPSRSLDARLTGRVCGFETTMAVAQSDALDGQGVVRLVLSNLGADGPPSIAEREAPGDRPARALACQHADGWEILWTQGDRPGGETLWVDRFDDVGRFVSHDPVEPSTAAMMPLGSEWVGVAPGRFVGLGWDSATPAALRLLHVNSGIIERADLTPIVSAVAYSVSPLLVSGTDVVAAVTPQPSGPLSVLLIHLVGDSLEDEWRSVRVPSVGSGWVLRWSEIERVVATAQTGFASELIWLDADGESPRAIATLTAPDETLVAVRALAVGAGLGVLVDAESVALPTLFWAESPVQGAVEGLGHVASLAGSDWAGVSAAWRRADGTVHATIGLSAPEVLSLCAPE